MAERDLQQELADLRAEKEHLEQLLFMVEGEPESSAVAEQKPAGRLQGLVRWLLIRTLLPVLGAVGRGFAWIFEVLGINLRARIAPFLRAWGIRAPDETAGAIASVLYWLFGSGAVGALGLSASSLVAVGTLGLLWWQVQTERDEARAARRVNLESKLYDQDCVRVVHGESEDDRIGVFLTGWYSGAEVCSPRSSPSVRGRAFTELVALEVKDFHGALLQGVSLKRARLTGLNMQQAQLEGADLRQADLRGTDLRWANLTRAHLVGSDLRGTELSFANLAEADLQGARLEGVQLYASQLRGASLGHTDATGAMLGDAFLVDVLMDNMVLSGADLTGAIMVDAYVWQADFGGADLTGAEIAGVDFASTDLQGAVFKGAAADGETRWPRSVDARLAGVRVVRDEFWENQTWPRYGPQGQEPRRSKRGSAYEILKSGQAQEAPSPRSADAAPAPAPVAESTSDPLRDGSPLSAGEGEE